MLSECGCSVDRPNHGLLTMYEFGETIGGLERCYYFGHGKDLYHFDHFMGELYHSLLLFTTVFCAAFHMYVKIIVKCCP